MPHGEFKTQGGKLVIADFQVNEDRLENVSISGDFFLEPPEALETINRALEGMPASTDESTLIDTINQALPDDVAMIGFSPDAVASAVRRGLEE